MRGNQDQDKMGEGGLVFVLPRRFVPRDFYIMTGQTAGFGFSPHGRAGVAVCQCHPNVVRLALQEALE